MWYFEAYALVGLTAPLTLWALPLAPATNLTKILGTIFAAIFWPAFYGMLIIQFYREIKRRLANGL